MSQGKSNKNDNSEISGPISYNNLEELSKKARELIDSRPLSVTSTKDEVYNASNTLVQSTQLIVESIINVIKDIEEQNKQVSLSYENQRMMMEVLKSELKASHDDNKTMRHLTWGSMVLLLILLITKIYTANLDATNYNNIQRLIIENHNSSDVKPK